MSSPIVARAAIRAATRAAPRRPFSVYTAIRSVGRAMEAHPFERLPVTQRSAAADWGRVLKSAGGRLVLYFPGMALILGWPMLFKLGLDGRMSY